MKKRYHIILAMILPTLLLTVHLSEFSKYAERMTPIEQVNEIQTAIGAVIMPLFIYAVIWRAVRRFRRQEMTYEQRETQIEKFRVLSRMAKQYETIDNMLEKLVRLGIKLATPEPRKKRHSRRWKNHYKQSKRRSYWWESD